ncbi:MULTISPECIES: hypothetical protein [Undibacterium]|uniref:DUF2782 domain-containing protein n=2 Tax=Undibacterium TaxID=401469 RepID=A0A941DRA5_9BURK|nr:MULTISPECIES: hypothetical protein [Undibacterium]MBC3935128.1 hypothetical protein [Undibacterium rugosum]MBR7780063.1 hypothetical protein [Undibacterium rugosum]MBR7784252.1 hypothetical protein [Undibacterium luofuense]
MNKSLSSVIAVIFSAQLAIPALAQTPAKAEVPPPPKMEKLEEGPTEKSLSVGKPEQKNKVVEKKNNAGKVTEVEVKSGKSSYTLKADPQAGNAQPGTVQGQGNRAAQWKLLEFGGKKEVKEAPEPLPVLPPAPVKAAPASAVAK